MVRKHICQFVANVSMRLGLTWLAVAVVLLLATATASASQVGIQTVYDTITQGETGWYTRYISSSTFTVYLVWNNPSNSLTLTMYSPDGSVYGPFRDADDGRIDGRVVLTVSNAQTGIWVFKVYGEKVTGVQSYSFAVV